MSLADKLVSSFLAFELDINIQSPVHVKRTKALKEFEKLGFPTKKNEAWKYTSLKTLLKEDYTIFSKKKNVLDFKNIKNYFLDNTESYKIVFVDGFFDPFLSQTSHDGVDICILSAALTKPGYSKIVSKYFDSSINKKDSLSLINTAFAKEGVYVHIPKNKILDKPIEVLHFATGNEAALMLQPRNLIVVEKNAQVEIIETHQSLPSNILFIAGGAFDGIERHINKRLNLQAIGYNTTVEQNKIDKENILQYITPRDVRSFGLIPEIIGRLPVLTFMKPLDKATLLEILTTPKNALIKQYIHLFDMDGIKLQFTSGALNYIVEKSMQYKLGARGLRSLCEAVLNDAMFELPDSDVKELKVTKQYADQKLSKIELPKLKVVS